MHLAANHKWKNKNKKWKHKEKVNGTLSSHDSCRKQTGEHSNLRRHTAYQYQHHKQKLADQGLFQWQNCQVFNDRMTRFSTTKWPGLVEIEDFCSHKHHNTLFSNPPPPISFFENRAQASVHCTGNYNFLGGGAKGGKGNNSDWSMVTKNHKQCGMTKT